MISTNINYVNQTSVLFLQVTCTGKALVNHHPPTKNKLQPQEASNKNHSNNINNNKIISTTS